MRSYAPVAWTVHDVRMLAPDLSEIDAERWLIKYEGQIQNHLIDEGWSLLADILAFDGLTPKRPT